MSDLIKAAILGVVEGVTEFLPISSTGHMIIVMPALKIDGEQPPWHVFLYFIQIGAILSVIAYFGRKLWRLLWQRPAGGLAQHLLAKLAIASLPAVVIGLPLDDWIEAHLETPVVVAIALIAGGFLIEVVERRARPDPAASVATITSRQALLIGLAQCVSMIPGTSRSMATILGGMLVGLPAAVAVEFSFYLAIPTLLGAGLLKLFKHRGEIHASEALMLAVGFGVAFVCALFVVFAFLKFMQKSRLRTFVVYRIGLGALVLLRSLT